MCDYPHRICTYIYSISLLNTHILSCLVSFLRNIYVPNVSDDGVSTASRPLTKEDGIISKCKASGEAAGFTHLVNKKPSWSSKYGAYVLDFKGRVKLSSVKNFQLVTLEDPETVVLLFGRCGQHNFSCDFRYPLSPFQAFAICLSALDTKLGCE